MSHVLSDQELGRRDALQKLRALGIEPYPAAQYHVSHTCKQAKEGFKDSADGTHDTEVNVVLAGRLMSVRVMGKASFAVLRDASGDQQIYVNRDEIAPGEDKTLYNEVFKKLLHLGDFIGVKGYMFRTQTGEVTLHVKELTVLAKALRPLPVVKTDEQGNIHDAFTDPEQRYRMRYVDLIVNPHVKETFLKRTRVFNAMRESFQVAGYIEVDTPAMQPIPGGAAARPFSTHHNALDTQFYLRVSNELYLKRLIVAGFDGVFEFSRNFRNEGMDRTHNPEFTIMELYVAYKDYRWMMDFIEGVFRKVATAANGTAVAKFQGKEIDFGQPFKRITMCGAIQEKTGVDVLNADEPTIGALCKQHGIEITAAMGKGKLIDELFSELVQPELILPTFVMDFPLEMSPLCKKHRDDDRLTERFELYVAGFEVGNAYSELNDPIDQRERFEDQVKLMERGDDEAMFIDQDFLRALEYGMPPTSGIGIGMDRLVMLLTDNPAIQEVLLFPQMRPEKFDVDPIYTGMRTLAMLAMLALSLGSACAQDPLADKVYFGFGAGLDHGGLGVRIDVRPVEYLGVFGGVGWALGGLGWNAGLHVPILPGRGVSPYITGMYGYNTVYVVKDRTTGTQWDRDIYNGPSFGGGVEFSFREGARLLQVGLLVPVRSDQVLTDHPSIENDLWPVLFSLGLRFRV